MDIQQTDRESLATYVHRFKWEASRCKFSNDATTIRVFLKGLKNAHAIVTKVYEKGPQTLVEATKEVEKLQATQQITSTLLPTSLVITMSSDNDRCFQCQEISHMACYCPHIQCFDCDNYRHVARDCPDEIPLSGTPACHKNNITTNRHNRSAYQHCSHNRHPHCDHWDRHRQSHSRSHSHNPRHRSTTHHDSHRSCSRSFHRPSHCSSSHHRSWSLYCCCHDTPHHRPSSYRHFSQDDNRSWQHKSHWWHYKPAQGSSLSSKMTPWECKDRRHKQVTNDDPPSEYCSSDDQDSDSEDDLN